MTFRQQTRNGLALCWHSLRVVWRDKTLVAFPLASTIIILVTLWLFYLSVGNDKIQLLVNTRVNQVGQQSLNYGYYVVIFFAYLFCSFATTFNNLALSAATHISITERDSKLLDGVRAGGRSSISLIIWTLFNSTIGTLFTILDQQKNLSQLLRSVLKSGWSVFTYFVIPVMAIEKKSIFTALARSRQIMMERWGENATARFGIGWFLLILNIPVFIFLLIEWYTLHLSPFIFVLSVSWTLFALVLATTAKQVLTVALYLYASTGKVPDGWDEEALKNTFRGSLPAGAPPQPMATPTATEDTVKNEVTSAVEESSKEA